MKYKVDEGRHQQITCFPNQKHRHAERTEKKQRWNAIREKMSDNQRKCLAIEERAKTMRYAQRLMEEGDNLGLEMTLTTRAERRAEKAKKKAEKRKADGDESD